MVYRSRRIPPSGLPSSLWAKGKRCGSGFRRHDSGRGTLPCAERKVSKPVRPSRCAYTLQHIPPVLATAGQQWVRRLGWFDRVSRCRVSLLLLQAVANSPSTAFLTCKRPRLGPLATRDRRDARAGIPWRRERGGLPAGHRRPCGFRARVGTAMQRRDQRASRVPTPSSTASDARRCAGNQVAHLQGHVYDVDRRAAGSTAARSSGANGSPKPVRSVARRP